LKSGLSANAVRALDRIDWNFPGSTTPPASLHTLHWFPGNFIPQIPRVLVEILSKEGDQVLDPFSGSGTTGVEAMALGRCSRQSDINSASIQVAKGKLAALTRRSTVRRDAGIAIEKLMWDFVPPDFRTPREHEVNPELRLWLHPDTLQQLQFIWVGIISAQKSKRTRDVFEMLFSDTLFACASPGSVTTRSGGRRRHHWGWIADNVQPKAFIAHNALAMFRRRLIRLQKVLANSPDAPTSNSGVFLEDARNLTIPDNTIDAIITSPPYLGMIDYTLANRLTFLWMGWSLREALAAEIGARRYRNRPAALQNYRDEMRTASLEMHRVLKEGSFCAVVVGASRKYPEAVTQLADVFRDRFQLYWGPRPRTPTRRRISERKGSTPTEYIIVFRK
jgi:DNA methylase